MKTQRSACKWHASGTATTMCCCDANSLLIGLDSDNAWAAAESSSALVLGGRVSNNCKWKQLQVETKLQVDTKLQVETKLQVRGSRRRQLSQQTVKPTKIYRTREDENPDAPSELDTQVPLAAAMHEINRQQNKQDHWPASSSDSSDKAAYRKPAGHCSQKPRRLCSPLLTASCTIPTSRFP